MARSYTLKKRANQQAETRRRIVDAAVDLHSSVGPAATTFSMLAEKAGVQRHTLYAHFPDERSLLAACSGCVAERDPLPDAASWHDIADAQTRLAAGLRSIYAWYARNEALMACVLRDAEHHAPTREISVQQFGPVTAAWLATLGAPLKAAQRAMLHLALSFHSWRTLVRTGGLTQEAAMFAMVQAVMGAH